MNAMFWPQTDNQAAGKYEQFDAMMNDCDLVLAEGDSQTSAAKIEVFRLANGREPIAVSDLGIHAIVTDDILDAGTIIWKRSDLETKRSGISG